MLQDFKIAKSLRECLVEYWVEKSGKLRCHHTGHNIALNRGVVSRDAISITPHGMPWAEGSVL